MRHSSIELTNPFFGGIFLAASARFERYEQIAQAARRMLFDDDVTLADQALPELVEHQVGRSALLGHSKAA